MTAFKKIITIILLSLSFGFTACRAPRNIPTDPGRESKVSEIQKLESTVLLIDATRQKILGNWANAIVLYSEATKKDPFNSAALFELAKIHARQGYLADAEKFAFRAVQIEPQNKYYLNTLADIYFLQEKNEQGLKVHQNLAKQYPNNPDIHLTLASIYIYLKRFDEALAVFNHLESIVGFNEEISIQKQKLFLQSNQTNRAIEEAKRLISFMPDDPMYLEMLADMYMETGQQQKALEIYQAMQEKDPDNPMVHLLLADYYRGAGQEERSFDHLRRAFINPRLDLEGKARIMYSYYQVSQQNPKYLDQAYLLLEELLRTHAGEAETYAIYGDFLLRDKRLEEARNMFMKAAQTDPSNFAVWQQLMLIDSEKEDYAALLETTQKASEFFFEQPSLFFFQGIANLQLEYFQDAVRAFEMGLGLTAENKELQEQFYTLLGDSYYKLKNTEKAFEAYEKALAINPANIFALNNYSYYLSLENRELEKARTMSEKANRLEMGNASFQDTYGWIMYKMGNYKEARMWIEMAMESAGKPSGTIYEHYGDVLFKLGEVQQAVEYWKKAKDTGEASKWIDKKINEQKIYE